MQKPKGLGRGIEALIGSNSIKVEREDAKPKTGVLEIDINKIEPNNNQPRKFFDEQSILELADSIKSFGVIQPLILKDEGGFYSIIAGERRWRAARIAKLSTIPAIIKDYNKVDTMQIALIENIQREDLNPIEEAECYKRLADDYLFSQEDIANKIGKAKSVVCQYLSLLNLDKRVKQFLIDTKLNIGHGKILLTVTDSDEQFNIAEHVIENELTVKQLESYIQNSKIENTENPKNIERVQNKQVELTFREIIKDMTFVSLENELKNIIGTKVNIKNGKKKGKIEIEYYNTEELDRIVCLLKQTNKELLIN